MNPLYLMLPDLRQVSLPVRLTAVSVPDVPDECRPAAERSAARRQHNAIVKIKLFII